MGLYGALRSGDGSFMQLVATTIKVPALFLLTLLVTFPSLYVFSALCGSRLGPTNALRLMLVAIGIDLAVLASFGPVTAFFTFSTESYPFMVLLNVGFFAIAGIIGLAVLHKLLRVVYRESSSERTDAIKPPSTANEQRVFRIWIGVYGIVGAQMGWILRPFIGTPGRPFEWFRERESNFFAAIFEAVHQLLFR